MTEPNGRAASPRIRIAVSACLLGEPVRYDGDHSRSAFVTEALGACFELLPDCPEMGIGLGAPRPKIGLEATANGARLVDSGGGDLTPTMRRYAADAARAFAGRGVAGVVLKSKSPSCGTGDAAVIGQDGVRRRDGTGIYAAELAAALPDAAVISEAGLLEPERRDHWLTRVFAAGELAELAARSPTREALRRFAGRWRTTLFAHKTPDGGAGSGPVPLSGPPEQWARALRRRLRDGLTPPPSAAGHRRVLDRYAARLRAAGVGSGVSDAHDRIDAFAAGRAPLAEAVRTIARLAEGAGDPELRDQAYLAPRPAPLRYREDLYREQRNHPSRPVFPAADGTAPVGTCIAATPPKTTLRRANS